MKKENRFWVHLYLIRELDRIRQTLMNQIENEIHDLIQAKTRKSENKDQLKLRF